MADWILHSVFGEWEGKRKGLTTIGLISQMGLTFLRTSEKPSAVTKLLHTLVALDTSGLQLSLHPKMILTFS